MEKDEKVNNWSKNLTDFQVLADESEDDNSDNNLHIDLGSPVRKRSRPNPSRNEQIIIESIEDELEKQLTEKAEKNKLNAINVKNIIRHVLTNEHVLALLRKAENPAETDVSLTAFEPKLTRAKAKELLSSSSSTPLPWMTPKPSETHVLVSEDLQEDSSGDEYVPGADEESEDDKDSSIASESDIPSIPPATPPAIATEDSSTQTNWTEDGLFKLPPTKSKYEEDEAAIIALRTRSKINLTSTPLEVIEKSFIPPDITTDMYDMECDDDDWKDFLNGFTQPLDEITKANEDEDHDPEYNILADGGIDRIDKEELRMDKAVKITRKEVKELWEELFEYIEKCSEDIDDAADNTLTTEHVAHREGTSVTIQQPVEISNQTSKGVGKVIETLGKERNKIVNETVVQESVKPKSSVVSESTIEVNNAKQQSSDVIMDGKQILLVQQQLRQHVQMLTQNFILTYNHPEYHEDSKQYKEYLINLRFLTLDNVNSVFMTINLPAAIKLVEYWENLLALDKEACQQTRSHTEKCLVESLQNKTAGCFNYVLTFPPLILRTISNSDVFMYPSLLPRIPFKSKRFFSKIKTFTEAEDQLIVLGLEQFETLLKKENNKKNMNFKGDVKLRVLASYISNYMMPHIEAAVLCNHIRNMMQPRCARNPIKSYHWENRKKVQPFLHYIFPISAGCPPCKQKPEELPFQWREFIYKPESTIQAVDTSTSASSITRNRAKPTEVNLINLKNYQQLVVTDQTTLNLGPILLPKANFVTSTPISRFADLKKRRRKSSPKYKQRRLSAPSNTIKPNSDFKETSLSKFINCLARRPTIGKIVWLFRYKSNPPDPSENPNLKESFAIYQQLRKDKENSAPSEMMPSMPALGTPVKAIGTNENIVSTTTQEAKVSSSIDNVGSCSEETGTATVKKSSHFDFSGAISSSSFQQPDTSTEVEFCKANSTFETFTTHSYRSVFSSQSSTKSTNFFEAFEKPSSRDNPEDINALMLASSTVKPPAARKEPSGAEKKRAKIRREFLANLAIASPEDPVAEKQKSSMFAMAYYDKLRETLELQDYNKATQILNEFELADAVDLYRYLEPILVPKYQELADEFLLFLREREAASVGKLIPWIRMSIRAKFLRKLELYFKDQPAQLMKIYKCLNELSQSVDLTIEKIKSTVLPMLKGNTVLTDLFLQNFLNERPPLSLLEGPYEVMDINKEMARLDSEEPVETIVVPDVEDKYGGSSCICQCHKIEDPEFTSRYRHCRKCGIKFCQGRVYMQTGKGLRPANISFDTSPNTNHSARLSSKSSTNHRKKVRSESSPSKQVVSTVKYHIEEETEDETDGKKKAKGRSRSPRKSKKVTDKRKEPTKPPPVKKSPVHFSDNLGSPKAIKIRKRSYSGRKSKKVCLRTNEETKLEEEGKLKEGNSDNKVDVDLDLNEDQQGEHTADELAECDFNGYGESTEKPPTSPEQHTAESESEFCEESSQDNCETDSNSSESSINSQSDMNDEPSWQRDEDKIILETFQQEDDKECAFQIISEKLTNRTIRQIRSRFSTLMDLLIEQVGSS